MNASLILLAIFAALLAAASMGCDDAEGAGPASVEADGDGMTLTDALAARRSVRRFKGDALSPEQIATLCWAAQGVTDKRRGFRAAPSAGALYPLELYVVTAAGVDHYDPKTGALTRHLEGDLRPKLQAAALGQRFVGDAPATFVLAAVIERTTAKYGRRAQRYVWVEVGHAAQNVLLQAVALKLGAVPVGAFDDAAVAKALSLPANHAPALLIPTGAPK